MFRWLLFHFIKLYRKSTYCIILNSNGRFEIENRCLFLTYLFRFRTRTLTHVLEKILTRYVPVPQFSKKALSTFRTRILISKMKPYPLRSRTYNFKTTPFPLRSRFRTWVRERNGYGISTRTPDSGLS